MGHNSTTDTNDINYMGNYFLKTYQGCLPADIFVNNFKKCKNGVYVVNTENHNQSGQHWLCFIKYDNGKLLAYDSYAQNINDYNPLFKKLDYWQDRSDWEQDITDENMKNCGFNSLSAGMIFEKYGIDGFKSV